MAQNICKHFGLGKEATLYILGWGKKVWIYYYTNKNRRTNNKKIRTLSYYDVNHKLLKKIVDKNPKPTFYSFFENNTIFDLHLNQVEVLNLSDKDFLKIDKKII